MSLSNIFPSNGSLFTQIIDDTETMSSKYDNLFRTLRAFKWKTENCIREVTDFDGYHYQ